MLKRIVALAFAAAHPDFYAADGNVRLAVRDGALSLRSLDVPGYASAALPRFDTLANMRPYSARLTRT